MVELALPVELSAGLSCAWDSVTFVGTHCTRLIIVEGNAHQRIIGLQPLTDEEDTCNTS